ncbi:amino acid transporter [Sphingopyxis panaciterrae]|uniref:amino acid permease n=1 Tax=Sphingopyxis panaciterrae TaxID=363841 RepID=UPI00142410E6|nr:amino acid transporter [Sphingopyxis panaciterrae]
MTTVPKDGIPEGTEGPGFQKTIRPAQFAIFGFGGVVGTSWVVLLGGFLMHAGPAGTMLGIALGGAAIAMVAAMYAELASRFPQTGGEVTYVTAVFGRHAGFVVGWLLTIVYLSNLIFEGVALSWLVEILWPTLIGPTLYMAFGEPIRAGGLFLALTCCLVIAVLNYRGAHSFVRFQNVMTMMFLAIVFVTVGLEFSYGSVQNMQPFWQAGDGGSWLVGVAWVFGSAPMILAGFQSVLHTIEERSPSTSKETVVRLCVAAVVCAVLFYLIVILAAIQAAPWRELAASGLPPVEALSGLPWSGAVKTIFLLALIISLIKTWNSVFMTAVRLLFAQSREGMIPAVFAHVNAKTGAPGKGVIAVAIFNFIGVFLGKGLIEPLVNVMSVCIALTFVLICAATLVMRRRDPGHSGFKAYGGYPAGILAIVAASGMVFFALVQPAPTNAAAAFKWGLLVAWALIGTALYIVRNRRIVPVERMVGSEVI